jgi:hypothetical protein
VTVHVRALRGTVGTAGLAVRLEMQDGSAWRTIRSGRSGAQGMVSWSLLPDRTRIFRAVVEQVPAATVAVQVRQRATARYSRTRSGVVATGTAGPLGRSTAVLQRRTPTGWTPVVRVVAGTDGRFRLGARLPRGTVVRVAVAARPGLLGTVTAPTRVG